MIQSRKKRPSKYNVVDDQKREQIVEKIFKEKMKIKEVRLKHSIQVAQLFQIPLSTVKAVKSVYLKEGRIQKKAKRNRPKKVVTTIIVALIDKNKIPTDANEIQKCTKVSFGHANQNGNLTEQCMKQGIDLLMQMLTQIRKNQPSIGKHSAMLSKLLKNYQQQCKSFD
ncbi:unnamed protein product (macronuclear) [Paramecium tetraurelia]|uniref:HTH psq-type domain-containing protein n=1 Tax=Paramecium tetraurelia TaxID=5888 RepID=A0CAC7_PARTE|nr:uncharacterized protein GSPATT00036524001 [Paramecium tetraurelia]CAK67744.1 unnamed protein product [Paramecium tetraurelia]|eukprot:XP_001435141.1 hypothetical protein (macronuclear) [Paramecium tetraurelia strain d4-2]